MIDNQFYVNVKEQICCYLTVGWDELLNFTLKHYKPCAKVRNLYLSTLQLPLLTKFVHYSEFGQLKSNYSRSGEAFMAAEFGETLLG